MAIYKWTTAPTAIKIWTPYSHDDYSAMQWPCATGFHVPTSSEWSAVRTAWINMGAWTSSWSTSITNIKNYLKIPLPWSRSGDSWSYDGMWNSFWEYWTCTRASYWNAALRLFIRNDSSFKEIFAPSFTMKSNWLPIRPFKDEIVIPDSSWTVLYQWTWTAWIYRNSALWLISISSDWTTRYTIADKNLWATTVYSNWASLSEANCGKFYQRWNNYWFPYSWSVTTSSTQVDASNYWPWNYYSSSTFIYRTASPYGWDSSDNNDLRWWETWIVQRTDTDIKKVYLGSTQVRPPIITMTISRTEQSNMSSGWTYSDDAAWLTAGDSAFDDFFWYSAVLLNTSGVETAEMKQSWGVFSWAMTTLWNITSGDNVMIKFPVRWIKMTKSWSTVTLSITKELNKSWYQYYAFQTGTLSSPWTAKDAFYLWAYEWYNSSSVLKSWSWQTPTWNQTQSTFCTRAKANGSWYNIIGFYQKMYISALYMMKYWNPDSQTTVWAWDTYGGLKTTWWTNSQTNASYWTSSKQVQCKLFWLEDRWGNVYDNVGGVYTNGSRVLYTMLTWWTWWVSWWESTWVTIPSTNKAEMSAIAWDNKAMFAPVWWVSNSSYNTYYCDRYSWAANALFQAGWYYADILQWWIFRAVLSNNTSIKDSIFGSRLMYLNWLS